MKPHAPTKTAHALTKTTHALTKTKKRAHAKTGGSTTSSFVGTTVRALSRRVRGARKLMSTFGSNTVRYAKQHPTGTIASALLVGAAVLKVARRT